MYRREPMLSRLALIVLCVCAGVGCTAADDQVAANKVFVETVQLLQQAAAAKPSEAVGLYEKALRNLDSIIANYPSSDLAVQIISGQAIGQVSRISIEKALEEARQTTAIKKELEKLQGTWVVVSSYFNGKSDEQSKGTKLMFADEKLIVTSQEGAVQKETYKLDPTMRLRAIDLVRDYGEIKITTLGIYELEGDTLKLCMGSTDR
jgi:uncharacterized protein (TIGR03067 family)